VVGDCCCRRRGRCRRTACPSRVPGRRTAGWRGSAARPPGPTCPPTIPPARPPGATAGQATRVLGRTTSRLHRPGRSERRAPRSCLHRTWRMTARAALCKLDTWRTRRRRRRSAGEGGRPDDGRGTPSRPRPGAAPVGRGPATAARRDGAARRAGAAARTFYRTRAGLLRGRRTMHPQTATGQGLGLSMNSGCWNGRISSRRSFAMSLNRTAAKR
jgi:hypothetical protein